MFRKTYDLYATPVVIEYRTDTNPYDRERRGKRPVGSKERRSKRPAKRQPGSRAARRHR
jgi:hypothetical protein